MSDRKRGIAIAIERIRRRWTDAPELRPIVIPIQGAVVVQFRGCRSKSQADHVAHMISSIDDDVAFLLLASSLSRRKKPSNDSDTGELTPRLRSFRIAAEQTIPELSRASGVSEHAIRAIESGTSTDSNLSTLIRLCRPLDISLDQLVGFQPDKQALETH